jgi:hypothetical protein
VTSRPEREKQPADVEIGAAARARRLRFRRKPETRVEFHAEVEIRGETEFDDEPGFESDSHTERKNLPEEVEPGKVYRDVEVGWIAGARISDAAARRAEQQIEAEGRSKEAPPSKES